MNVQIHLIEFGPIAGKRGPNRTKRGCFCCRPPDASSDAENMVEPMEERC
jgi:hypothetical protein